MKNISNKFHQYKIYNHLKNLMEYIYIIFNDHERTL